MPLIIPIFLMNRGCPHRCIFCNERLTAGDLPERVTAEAFTRTVREHLRRGARRKTGPVQIAFYGGTFTGMDPQEQRRLLELASPFLREGAVDGIRISTRPDGIDAKGLDLLKAWGVTTVEIGAQSLDDEVLLLAQRGHTARDIVRALGLLKGKGFSTGLHLMAGLPGDTPDRFAETVRRTIALRPDTVRIHPTLVLRGTRLAGAFREGIYRPLALDDAVRICRDALRALTAAGIPVIRLGLQTTRELEEPGAVVAGPFHPGFGSLVEASLCFEMASALLSAAGPDGDLHRWAGTGRESPPVALFSLSPADVTGFSGPQRANIEALRSGFSLGAIRVHRDPALPRRTLILEMGETKLRTDCSGRIRRILLHEKGPHDMDHETLPTGA